MDKLAARDGPELARETFLLAATRLINRRGYRGASVDKISAELNVTKGSFYHHNEAKDDLVVACFERSFEVMTCGPAAGHGAARATSGTGCRPAPRRWPEFQLSEHGPLLRTTALTALPETDAQVDGRSTPTACPDRFASMISDGHRRGLAAARRSRSSRPRC
jgi:AcrR family transcriptional regulator